MELQEIKVMNRIVLIVFINLLFCQTSIDFNRKFKQHLSFGHGIHYCLGSTLARMEATVMFKKLLPLINEKNLIEEITFDSTFFLRWPKSIKLNI